jgi:hypothetical protein
MPSFVTMTGPGTATVTDDAALAITAQTSALTAAITGAVGTLIGSSVIPGTLGAIDNKLDLIANQLTGLADNADILSKTVSDLKSSQAALVSLQQESNIMQTMAVSDQIDTNRFQTQVTNEALDRAGIPRPKMPPFLDTLKETLKKVKDFNVLVEAEGLMKSATDKLTSLVKEQLTSFDKTFGITEWIKQKTEALKAAILPSTRKAKAAIESKTKVTWAP